MENSTLQTKLSTPGAPVIPISLIVSAKAFIVCDKKVLIVRESEKYLRGTNPGKFDVVGGRINPEEEIMKGLLREIDEETRLEVKVGLPFSVNEWNPIIDGKKQRILGIFFECFSRSKGVHLSDGHDEYRWIDPRTYLHHDIIKGLDKAFADYLRRCSDH